MVDLMKEKKRERERERGKHHSKETKTRVDNEYRKQSSYQEL